MQLNSKASFVAYLMLVSLCVEVSAECCSGDSLICCSRTNEILVIAALIVLCVVFFIQCVIIIYLAQKLNKAQKRLDIVYLHSRGSSYTMYSTFPGFYSPHENAMEETEESDRNINIPRARHVNGSHAIPGKSSPAATSDNPNNNSDKEIWGLY